MNRIDVLKRLGGLAIVIIVAAAFVAVGCDSAGAGGGGGGDDTTIDGGTVTVTAENDRTVTVALSGASGTDGDHLWAWLYGEDEWNTDSKETILAAGSQLISGGSASFVLNESDGNWGYTDIEWSGETDMTYDMMIFTGSADAQPTDISTISEDHPIPVSIITVTGNTNVKVSEMVTYAPTTGALTVILTGTGVVPDSVDVKGKDLVVGVFPEDGHPAEDEPLTYNSATIDETGTATITISPWDGMTAATQYDVFIIIFMEDRGEEGPQPGEDYIYKTHTEGVPWYVYGDRTMRPADDDFILIPTE
jgi:hypothetical protein